MQRSINQAGLDLVKRFEGFRAEAYLCPAGVWTIGYGHTGDVDSDQTITENLAEELLRDDISEACAAVERLVEIELNENQFASLASFAFNAGAGSLSTSTLRRKLNAGNYDAVPSELNRWVKATDPVTGKKRTLAGLVRRRAAEGELWLTPDGDTPGEHTGAMPQRLANVDGDDDSTSIPTLQQVTTAMRGLEYEIFDGVDGTGRQRNYDLNIFGIRNDDSRANSFDDWVGVFWMNWEDDAWEYHVWPATTDPGRFYRNAPLNTKGTAILVEGQHRSSHKIGLHRGKYEALVQQKSVPVYRDDNCDDVLDMAPDTIDRGMHGINIHRASAHRRSKQIDKWSAGCQVIADPSDFARLMDICDLSAEEWGPIFSYTLLTKTQLEV